MGVLLTYSYLLYLFYHEMHSIKAKKTHHEFCKEVAIVCLNPQDYDLEINRRKRGRPVGS